VIPASDIDRLLLSCCDARWRKVARIIGQTYEALEARGFEIFHGIAKLMDARMALLVRSGKLEAKGNINAGAIAKCGCRRAGQSGKAPQASALSGVARKSRADGAGWRRAKGEKGETIEVSGVKFGSGLKRQSGLFTFK